MIRTSLARPLPIPADDYDRTVLDAFIKAGRDAERITETYARLTAGPLLINQRQVVDDYYRAALRKIGIVL